MRLVRNNLFETNSSSAHSLAFGTSKIIRGAGWGIPEDETDFSNPLYHLYEIPSCYQGYTLHEWLGEYGWGYDVLSTPQEKFSYLITGIWQRNGGFSLEKSMFYTEIKHWLTELGIPVIESSADEEGYIDHESTHLVNPSLFKTKEDLITYLFNDNIVIYIENDNDEYQEWYTGERSED
jgi:hypothetical protein|nr:MAG TPA: hypothetical protein [Caudoviricetes sp.]